MGRRQPGLAKLTDACGFISVRMSRQQTWSNRQTPWDTVKQSILVPAQQRSAGKRMGSSVPGSVPVGNRASNAGADEVRRYRGTHPITRTVALNRPRSFQASHSKQGEVHLRSGCQLHHRIRNCIHEEIGLLADAAIGQASRIHQPSTRTALASSRRPHLPPPAGHGHRTMQAIARASKEAARQAARGFASGAGFPDRKVRCSVRALRPHHPIVLNGHTHHNVVRPPSCRWRCSALQVRGSATQR